MNRENIYEEDIFTKLKTRLARDEEILRKVEFKVLVWGPGDDFFEKKRSEIIARLRERDFQAFTSEELAKQVPSTLPLPQQELRHWEAVDLVIVLEAGIAPAMELALYAWFPEFCEKCIVYHRKDYDPTRRKTFPANLLSLFANRVLYADEEMLDCRITNDCLHRAEAFRRYLVLKRFPQSVWKL